MKTKIAYEDDKPKKKQYNNVDVILEPGQNIGGLHLGDFTSAQDSAYFTSHKISCVLTVAACDFLICPKDTIRYHKIINADDVPSFKLNEHFKECFQFIHEHRNKGRGVLVHCMAGVSRSATIVIGYLMTVYPAMNLESAFNHVRKKRRIIRPNDGFLEQLRKYDEEIQEKRKKKEKVL